MKSHNYLGKRACRECSKELSKRAGRKISKKLGKSRQQKEQGTRQECLQKK